MPKKLTIENARMARDLAQGAVKHYADKNDKSGDDIMLSLHDYMVQIFREEHEENSKRFTDGQDKTEPVLPPGAKQQI